jgi:hypothetical protein
MEETKNNPDQIERKVEAVMIKKAHAIYGLLTFVVAFIAPIVGLFFKIQLDIALIKQNHEAHIERALDEIVELKAEDVEQKKEVRAMRDDIIRLLEIHEK